MIGREALVPTLAAIIVASAWAGPAQAWNPLKSRNGHVKKGNALYGKEKWEEAKVSYGKASLELPEEPGVPFDMGGAIYKSGTSGETPDSAQLDSAAQAFMLATTLAGEESKPLEASAYYNLGNVRFKQERWEEAIEAYRQSLKAAPGNKDAAFNLALALEKLEEQKKREEEERKKQEEEQKRKEEEQTRKEEEQKKQEEQQQCDQGQDQQQKQQDQQQQDQGQDKPEQGQDQQQQQQQGQQQKQEQAPVPLTQQEAEAILDALQRGEKNFQLDQQAGSGPKGTGKPEVEKDW